MMNFLCLDATFFILMVTLEVFLDSFLIMISLVFDKFRYVVFIEKEVELILILATSFIDKFFVVRFLEVILLDGINVSNDILEESLYVFKVFIFFEFSFVRVDRESFPH